MRQLIRRFLGLETRTLGRADLPWLSASVPTASGMTVSVDSALRVPVVSAAVRAISEAAMTLPARVEVTQPGGAPVEAPDHPVSSLIREGVNEWLGWPLFVRDLVISALCFDEGGLAWVNRINGQVREVIAYRRGMISVETLDTGEPRYHAGARPLAIGEVVHLRAPFGQAPLTLAREAIGRVAVMEHHAAKLFANGARPGGVLTTPGKLGPDTAGRLADSWNATLRGEGVGKTAILEEGMKFEQLAFNSVDAQFAELRTFELQEIARAFRVPPHILFDLGRATWSNSEQMGLEFLTYALEPWLQALEDTLRRSLFTAEERRTHRVVFDRDDLTRADLGARAAAYSSLISARVLNPNEARGWEGLPPYAGGELFANPNITTAPVAPPQE
jgi:HK97 family phage portal protein